MSGPGHCVSDDVLVTRDVSDVPVDPRQRLDPPGLFTVKFLLGSEEPEWVMIGVYEDRLIVF